MGIVVAQGEGGLGTHGSKGIVLSAFFIGYICTQMLGGFLARRLGSKPTLLLALGAWTAFDVLTPFAADLGLVPLVAVRIGMGMGEGMMYPCQHALSSYWVPVHERALLVTFMTSGQDIGSALANIVSPRLAAHGAAPVFLFWAALAVLWAAAYGALGASAPEVHPRCSASGEAAWIKRHRATPDFRGRCTTENPLPRRLLREPCVWAIVAGHIGVNYAWYVMLSWLPTFFKGRHGVDLASSPLLLCAPYLASWGGGVFGGFVSDRLVARGLRTRHVRKAMQAAGALLNALMLQLAAAAPDPSSACLFIAGAAFAGKLQNSGYWVNMVDICPDTAGTLMGISNTFATIPGIVGQPLTQALLDAGGGERSAAAWSAVFGVGGAVAALGAAAFAVFGDDRSLDATPPPGAAGSASRSSSEGAPRWGGDGQPLHNSAS